MSLKKQPFFWLHGIVVMVGLFVCATMIYGVISGADRGHPPAIVFMPLVMVVWIFLHVFLIFIQWLKNRGSHDALKKDSAKNSWPVLLIILVVLCGAASLAGFAALVNMWYSGRWPRYFSQWFMLLFNGVSFICLCGILLRQNWARLLAGLGCILVSGYFMYGMATRTSTIGYETITGDQMLMMAVALGLGCFGYHLLTSVRIKEFLMN